MDRTIEIELASELLELKAHKAHYLDDEAAKSPVDHYVSDARFEREREAIFLTRPHAIAHSSELAEPGAFLTAKVHGKPVLVSRDKQGEVRAFLNVCRHRGAELVGEESGCKHRFSCPYHAWTYSSDGRLLGAPHFNEGFPGLDKSELGLKQLPCLERAGFIWIVLSLDADSALNGWLEEFSGEIEQLDLANHVIVAEDTMAIAANWKILVEGGIEAYHFKVAHRDTIGPFFEDNLSSYRCYGDHMRSVLPRASMSQFWEIPQEEWRLRDHANVLYTFFPTNQLLVQQDHVIWISSTPHSAGETTLRLVTLAPKQGSLADGKDQAYWQRNHEITMMTLKEDFDIGEGIQRGLASGANTDLHFGRFEGALESFNSLVDAACDQG
ncbi:MAG: SRPBCC family protein [Pseudomonadota bacterium]